MGLVPDRMVQAITAFMDFCYLARQSLLDEQDLNAMEDALIHWEDHRSIFVETGVRPHSQSIMMEENPHYL